MILILAHKRDLSLYAVSIFEVFEPGLRLMSESGLSKWADVQVSIEPQQNVADCEVYCQSGYLVHVKGYLGTWLSGAEILR